MASGGSAPKSPDPKDTSAAQTGTNIGTAIANANLNNYDQITPDGTLKFDQTGEYTYFDSYTGKSYVIPKYTATQTLSAQQQAIKDQTDAAELNLGKLANSQSSFLNDYLGKPWDANEAAKATSDELYRLGSARLDPRFAREQEALNTKLAQQGIKLGSTAWDRAQSDFTQGKNDAYNQLALTGQGQAFSQAQAARNQPINEITALLSGSQVSQPNYVNPNISQIPTTDNAGIIQQDYQNRLNAWQQEQASTGSLLGGLFGLGASALKFSDRRLKSRIERIGALPNGLSVYAYEIGGRPEIGLMADEVAQIRPDAVLTHPSGFLMVDYAKAVI